MNTQLEKLFLIHNFSDKDRYDFMQIYNLLPAFKKVKVIDDFEEIVSQTQGLKQQLHLEQTLLFGETIERIESRLERTQKGKILSESKSEIHLLRQSF